MIFIDTQKEEFAKLKDIRIFGKDDEEHGDHRGCLIVVRVRHETGLAGVSGGEEGAGDDVDEGSDDQDEDEEREDDEQCLCALAHGALDDLADGFAVIADRCEQRTEVLQTAEEDTAEYAPQEDRNPAENGCLDRAVDRAGACDRREVMSHEDCGRRRNIVDTVFHGDSGCFALRVDAPLLCQPSAVADIADDKQHDGSDDNN